MTAPIAPSLLVLHVSIAARWWLYHLPYGPEAARFRDEKLYPGLVRLIAADAIEFQIFEAIVDDLSGDLNDVLANHLSQDVSQLFTDLQTDAHLELVAVSSIARRALLAAGLLNLPFGDAVAVTIAENTGAPLLVADEEVYARLKPLERLRPTLFIAWLPDSIDS